MPDRLEHLSATLASLREVLESADSLDEAQRADLHGALDEIQAVLDPDRDAGLQQPLLERLSGLTAQFEEEHPALTEALGRVVHALGQLGI